MFNDWESLFAAVVAVLFFGSFVLGMIWNTRKGNALVRWLRDGLPLVGERSTMHWIGTSVVEMRIAKAKPPFRSAETLVALEPRDIVFFWAYTRWRGRRDVLIFRAQLHTAPSFELHVFDPRAWTARELARRVRDKGWTRLEMGTRSLVGYAANADAATAQALLAQVERAGGTVVRLSVQRAVPNLHVHWLLPDPKQVSAHAWFSNLRQMGEQLTHE